MATTRGGAQNVSVWLDMARADKLRAMAWAAEMTKSDVLRILIDRAPVADFAIIMEEDKGGRDESG